MKTRYRIVWLSGERHYKEEFGSLKEAEAKFGRVGQSKRLRIAILTDVSNRLNPVLLKRATGKGTKELTNKREDA